MLQDWTTRFTLFTVSATLLASCAAIPTSQARDTEQLLAAAGFKMQRVDAADPQLHATPPYRVMSRTRNGAVEYVYADPVNCKCVYVGGPEEYSEYRRLETRDPWPPCDYQGLCWPW